MLFSVNAISLSGDGFKLSFPGLVVLRENLLGVTSKCQAGLCVFVMGII